MKKCFKTMCKKIVAVGLSASMIFSLSGCEMKSTMYRYISGDSGKIVKIKCADTDNSDFTAYTKQLFIDEVTRDTVTLHFSVKDPESYGIPDYEVTWGEDPFSDETIEKEIKKANDVIDTLNSYDYETLSKKQQMTYDVLMYYEEMNLDTYDYIDYYEPFAYTSGVQTNLPLNMAEYAFYDEQDVIEYLQLLESIPEVLNYYLDFEKGRAERGFFMSDTSADNVIKQCNDFVSKSDDNYLVQTFNSRIDNLGLSKKQAKEYKKENKRIVKEVVIPEFQTISDTFTSLKGTGTNENGLAHYDKGKEYYELLLKSKVGTNYTPDEIIQMLDKKISEEFGTYMTNAYANASDYQSYYTDGAKYPSTEPDTILKSLELSASETFPAVKGMDYSIEYVDESLEDSLSPAFCFSPTIDDYLKNNIYINGGSTDKSTIWYTLCHEGYPGHLYQFAYFYSTEPDPIRTVLNFNGYVEGWAEYVEMMAFDWAVNDDLNENIANFAKSDDLLNVLISSRVEIGVNYEGWTVDDCANYLTEKGFDGSAASSIFDYVVAEPANYQMYCVGMLTFNNLSEKASKALGDKFDLKEFHDVVLSAGPCQFGLLEQRVDEYINDHK